MTPEMLATASQRTDEPNVPNAELLLDAFAGPTATRPWVDGPYGGEVTMSVACPTNSGGSRDLS